MAEPPRKGFSLIEVLVVISLVAILLSLMLPAYQRQLRDTRRSLGGAALLETMMRQEQYFLGHKRYAETLTELSYPTDPYAVDAQGNVVGELAENKIYLIDLATRTNAYTLFAVPQSSQEADNACGILSLDSSGAKSVSGDGPGWRCW